MNSRASTKDIFYVVVLILTFITVIVGMTFALYSLISRQKEGTSAVYTGTLAIEYLSGEIINCNLLYPTENPSLETETNVYKNNFKVSNTGSLDSLIQINILINKNEFSPNTLKYVLYNSSKEEIATGYINSDTDENIANNLTLKHNTTEEFNLLIWIEETGKNQNQEMKKNLNGLIKVDAAQKID